MAGKFRAGGLLDDDSMWWYRHGDRPGWWDRAGEKEDGFFDWLATVPGTHQGKAQYDRLERLHKINKQPGNYTYEDLQSALDRGTGTSWRDDSGGQDFVNDWLARRQGAINKKNAPAPAPTPQPGPLPAAPSSPPPASPSPDPGRSGGDSSNGGSKSPYDFSNVLGMTPAEFDLEADLARIREQGNINTTIQNIITQSNNYIADVQGRTSIKTADISAGATKYASDRQKEATTYVADREKESALGVENIRTKGALDLQDIVNAGLKDVETIRGQSARDVATIGGEFDIQGEKIKGQTARDVARMDREKGIYGSLISAFQF
jgi:hypothetical protein